MADKLTLVGLIREVLLLIEVIAVYPLAPEGKECAIKLLKAHTAKLEGLTSDLHEALTAANIDTMISTLSENYSYSHSSDAMRNLLAKLT